MKTISLVNQKGGVGKTTTTLELGLALSERGERILFIDLDQQANLSSTLDTFSDSPTSFDLLSRSKSDEGYIPIESCIQHHDGYDLIQASRKNAPDQIPHVVGVEYRLREAVKHVVNLYDYIVIDTPPALNVMIINALTASDWLVIPTQADIYSLNGIDSLIATVAGVLEYYNPDLIVKGILRCRYNPRVNISKAVLQNLEEKAALLDSKIFSAAIRDATAIKESILMQQSIFKYAPSSNVAKDYSQFVTELLGE